MGRIDMSADYLVWDDPVEVVFVSARDTGPVTQAIATAKVRAIKPRELATSGGAYVGSDVVVLVPAALLTIGNPKPGDQFVTMNGQAFTVLQEQGGKRDSSGSPQTWRCVCRNLAVQAQLADVIDIQRAALTYDSAGGVVRHWPDGNAPGVDHGGSVVYSQVPAKVQLTAKDEDEQRGVRGLRERYTVILGLQVSLTREDRIRWAPASLGGAAVYLDVVRLYDVGRIDELPKVEAERAV